ncbi:hypothetical protein LCGC14_0747790 [marine sediment metagenome]|uniref:dihydrofolate reductase n=1 Tax=marine sediment metagenome TaxID=412755 RepID=A0A0F9QPQ6_9ZZZZ
MTTKRMLSAVFAIAEDMTIGDKGGIPWFSPADMSSFRDRTVGHIVVMGRKTWDSLPKKPLDDRHNLVLTRAEGEFNPDPRCAWILDPEMLQRSLSVLDPNEELIPYVIGGGEILNVFWNDIAYVYVTRIKGSPDGDTKFDLLTRLQDPSWYHEHSHASDDPAVMSVEWYWRTAAWMTAWTRRNG